MEERNERQPLLDPSDQHYDGESGNGKHLVKFHSLDDADNPLGWSKRRKWGIVVMQSLMAITVTFTCIGIVPVASEVVLDVNGEKDRSAQVLFVTIWELGEAAGPLFIAPLSEIFGRYPVYNVANTLFVAGVVLTALSQDLGVLIFSRFLTGCAVATNVLNPAIVGDMFSSETRGSAMSAVMLAPLIGGAVGPTLAGAIAEMTGWREIMWICVGLAVFCEALFLTLFRETYKVAILQKRAKRLRNETGDSSYKTKYDADSDSPTRTLFNGMIRPLSVIWSSTLLQALSIWGAVVFSWFYIFSTTLPDLLHDIYAFGSGQTGASFLSFSAGSIAGIAICNYLVDKIYLKLQGRRGGKFYPEGRLPLPIFGAFALPLVVLLYGWSAALVWPPGVLLFSVVLLGFAIIFGCVPMMTYVTDAFSLYSASALTAVLILRCLAGSFLPLAVAPLTDKIGNGPGYSIIAAICLVVAPIPVFVMRYGPHWRQRSKYTRDESRRESL